jgi:hypothetical protein
VLRVLADLALAVARRAGRRRPARQVAVLRHVELRAGRTRGGGSGF